MVKIHPSVPFPIPQKRWWITRIKALSLYWWKTKRTLQPLARIVGWNFFRSTVPAADVLASPQPERFRKAIWLVFCIPLVYFALTDLKNVLSDYNKYPVIYTISYETNDTLMFPDVTICNVNPLLKSKFCDESGPAWVHQDVEFEGELTGFRDGIDSAWEKGSVWTPFCRENSANAAICSWFCGTSNATDQRQGDRAAENHFQLSQWVKKMAAFGNLTQKLLSSMGHSITTAVDSCSYASNTSCGAKDKFFSYFNLDFNDLYGSCFCFLCTSKASIEYHSYRSLSTPFSGLVLTLNTEIEEYLENSREVGFVILIHEHGKKYSMSSDAIFASPGYTAFVGLEMTRNTNLEKPYENPCIRKWPEILMFDDSVLADHAKKNSYVREDCLSYCLVDVTIKHCACIPTDTVLKINRLKIEDYKYCTLSKKKCYETVKNKFGRLALEERCGCLQECHLSSYSTRISKAGFFSPVDGVEAGNIENRMKKARVVIYYHSFTYEYVRAIPKYTSVRVLGTIGSINGMYLGLSFSILYQALDIIVFSTRDFILARRRLHPKSALFRSAGVQTTNTNDISLKKDIFQVPQADNTKQFNTRLGPFTISMFQSN